LTPAYPPLPAALVEFAHGGASVNVGSASVAFEPECVRGVGVRVWPDACHLTVLVPSAPGAVTLANLRATPRIAVTLSHIGTHKTVQIKGRVLAVRDGTEDDRAYARRYRELFARDLAYTGMPIAKTTRVAIWPCHAIDVAIDVVYEQTPGPTAGAKLPLAERA
jgi:hypothetical protein